TLFASLGEIAVTAGRTSTFLGERYRRIAKRRGKQRALVAVGNSVLTIVWDLLADPQAPIADPALLPPAPPPPRCNPAPLTPRRVLAPATHRRFSSQPQCPSLH